MNNISVVKKLIKGSTSISCAESITGGMFAKYIVDVPGSSAVFDRSFVTYSNKAKIEELDVNPKTLKKFGAISKETAYEMAEGVYRKTKSDICISVTGNAGPDPAEDKPVGKYYVGLALKGKIKVYEFQSAFTGRNQIRQDACHQMFNLIKSAKG